MRCISGTEQTMNTEYCRSMQVDMTWWQIGAEPSLRQDHEDQTEQQ